MREGSKVSKYFREYRWSNVFAMIKNSSKKPRICDERCDGKFVVITGTTSGIGYHTARKYASRGANILCINRNAEKSEAFCNEIKMEYGVRCESIIADLSVLRDIHEVANKLLNLDDSIDVLIHNAGIYLTRKELTQDGIEKVFVVNYLSTFIINYVLLERLKKENKARIILVNSEGHRFAVWGIDLEDINFERQRYSGLKSYGVAKTAQLLSMLIFNDLLKGTRVTINAMHPGSVRTESGKDNNPVYKWVKKNIYDRFLKSPEISAEALYYLGVSKELEGISGKFFNLTTEEEPAPPALDRGEAYKLWKKSLELAGFKNS